MVKLTITIHNVLQGTPEWDKLRSDLYTGSGADKVLKFAGKKKIVNGVAMPYALNEIATFGGNFYTERGHILEEESLENYTTITGHRVLRPGFITNSLFKLCGYSPDGIDGEDDWHITHKGILLECKSFDKAKHLAMWKGNVPFKILAQIFFGLVICHLRHARLLIYNPDILEEDSAGNITNPDDAKYCFKIIDIKLTLAIAGNFKRILA